MAQQAALLDIEPIDPVSPVDPEQPGVPGVPGVPGMPGMPEIPELPGGVEPSLPEIPDPEQVKRDHAEKCEFERSRLSRDAIEVTVAGQTIEDRAGNITLILGADTKAVRNIRGNLKLFSGDENYRVNLDELSLVRGNILICGVDVTLVEGARGNIITDGSYGTLQNSMGNMLVKGEIGSISGARGNVIVKESVGSVTDVTGNLISGGSVGPISGFRGNLSAEGDINGVSNSRGNIRSGGEITGEIIDVKGNIIRR